jgi:hypothetical protein
MNIIQFRRKSGRKRDPRLETKITLIRRLLITHRSHWRVVSNGTLILECLKIYQEEARKFRAHRRYQGVLGFKVETTTGVFLMSTLVEVVARYLSCKQPPPLIRTSSFINNKYPLPNLWEPSKRLS